MYWVLQTFEIFSDLVLIRENMDQYVNILVNNLKKFSQEKKN